MSEMNVEQFNTKFIVPDNDLTYNISNSGNLSVFMRRGSSSVVLFSDICKTFSDHCGSGDIQCKRSKHIRCITLFDVLYAFAVFHE